MMFSKSFQERLLAACLIISFVLMCLVMGLLGAEYDEAWITASARQAFNADAVPSVEPVITSGGLHFLIVGAAQWLPISPLIVPRVLSLFAMVALYVVFVRSLRPVIETTIERRLIAVTCLAAPGTIFMAGLGYAAVLATLLFLSGILVALRDERISWTNALLAGVLLGCALATRWTMLPALPAVLLCAFFSRGHLSRNLVMCLLAIGVSVAVFAGLQSLQVQMLEGTGPSAANALEGNLGSAGVGRGLTPPARMYSFVVRFVTSMPVALVFLALSAALIWRQNSRIVRLVLVLLAASLLITGAWIVNSPFMHLRYIWPAYLMVAICAGLGLVALYREAQTLNRPGLRLAVVCFAALAVLVQITVVVRVVAMGTAMQVNSAGYESLEHHFKPFHHIQEQWAMVRYLDSLDPDTIVATIGMPPEFGALELALLSGRQVVDVAYQHAHIDGVPDLIFTHRFSPFTDAGQRWIASLGPRIRQVEGYSVYPFSENDRLPSPDDILLDIQLQRFGLAKWTSLTWR